MVGGRGLDLARPGQRDLLGRQPARHVGPYQAHYAFELGLVPVHSHPRLAQLGVGERLRPCPAPATRCGCASPRRRPSTATAPAPLPSACRTCACRGPSRSLRARPCPACGTAWLPFFPMSFLSLGRAFGPRFKKGFSDSAGHVPLSSRTKVKCSGELAN